MAGKILYDLIFEFWYFYTCFYDFPISPSFGVPYFSAEHQKPPHICMYIVYLSPVW